MKFEAEFILAEEKIPMDYRRCILSYIKYCLTEANDGKYLEEYYSPAKQKPFCFSVIFSEPTYLKEEILIKGKSFKLIISTADTRTGFVLFSAIVAQKGKNFKLPLYNRMMLIKVRQLKEKEVTSNKILIKMVEPLCVRKHNKETNRDWYFSPRQEMFEEECEKVMKTQLLEAGFSEEITDVKITPVSPKTIIVKHYGINIESSIGTFILEGDKTVLNYLLKSGM